MRASRRTAGICLLDRKGAQEQTGKRTAQERPDNGNRGVTPIGPAFACDRKNGVCDPRAEVACGIDGVSSGAAERKANPPHKASHKICAETRSGPGRGNAFREYRPDY